MNIAIFSDGGTNGNGNGAGATIIEINDGKARKRIQIASFLGIATNNEGEIFSALVGFYVTRLRFPVNTSLKWVSDSQYAIKSGTQYINNWLQNGWRTASKDPVKNQGLWRAFLALTEGISFNTEHVKGHSGHEQNEACDLAVNWIRDNANVIAEQSISKIPSVGDWYLWDARDALDELRHLDSSINLSDMKRVFSQLDDILDNKSHAPKQTSVNNEACTSPTEECLKELTSGYIAAVREISDVNSYLKKNKELKSTLMFLKKWATN